MPKTSSRNIQLAFIYFFAFVVAVGCVLTTTSSAQEPPPPVAPAQPQAPAKKPAATVPAATAPGAKPAVGPAAPANNAAPKLPAAPGAKPSVPVVAPPVAATGAAGKPKPKLETVELTTKDNIKLRAFYFASDKGKEAVPVIIVHEWEGQASPYGTLVKSLNDAGCAVIVPELRGHGGSRENGPAGRPFDIARMGKGDVANIIGGDMEAVKSFLRKENDNGKLNLNALVLIGVREGAVIAAQWAVQDLNFPSVGAMKQGNDVKSLVLVSPEKSLKGFTLDETLRDRLLWQLPFLIVVGRGSDQFAESDRFYKRLESMKKKAGKGTALGLELSVVATSLAGQSFVNDAPGVIDKITAFVKAHVVDVSAKIPWVERK